MKKTLTASCVLALLAGPAIAANNMENPLYLPEAGVLYSKTSAGLMIKTADSTDANILKNHDGETEFPIYRAQQDIGYGITDRLAVHGSFGYTHNGDIDRKGLHLGRVGMTYRLLTDGNSIWDVYADAHLGGVGRMDGSFTTTGFNYDNYSNGRWGFHVGTKMGHTWGKLTGAMFAEVLQTFGNDNNRIDVTGMMIEIAPGTYMPITALGMPDNISVDLKSTTEFNAGIKTFYELNDKWSWGASFTFKHHENNGVKGLATELPAGASPALEAVIIPAMLAQMKNMEDGFDEYIFGVSVARQLAPNAQVALYGEYTLDTAQRMSQNGSDLKAEVGVRLNMQF